MPQPLPKRITGWSWGAANLVKAEPLCMACIGAIALAWSEVEWALVYLVANASGASWKQGESGHSTDGNWAARVAMEQAETIRTRLKLMNAVLNPILNGNPLHDEWQNLQRRLQRGAQERNKVVHSRWGFSELAPNALIRDKGGKPEIWSASDFENVLRRIGATFGAVRKLEVDIAHEHAEGRITVPRW